jgi:hypothetical protein
MTQYRNRELSLAFLFMLVVSALYLSLTLAWRGIPAAKELFGHSLGILGFTLMLMTETLYSLRKRTRIASWGRMSAWLEFHIFTGLAGPFLVLLHTSWKFNGLAGVVTLLMIIVVASGFFGRYIYTSVPRTADGVELAASTLAQEINRAQVRIDTWLAKQPGGLQKIATGISTKESSGKNYIFGRFFQDLVERWLWRQQTRKLDPSLRREAQRLQQLLAEHRLLRSQLTSLAMARRVLAIWHAVHIPIGMALFTAAILHIAGAFYYATLLR